jgi:hypothetical protein
VMAIIARRWANLGLLGLLALAMMTGCGTGSPSRSSQATRSATPGLTSLVTDSFVTAQLDPQVASRSDPSAASPVTTRLQLRSVTDGHVTATVLSTLDGISGVSWAPDRSLLVAVGGSRCVTRLERVDLSNGKTTLMRTLDTEVGEIAVSPDGTRLAYTTWQREEEPCRRVTPGPGGLVEFWPYELNVLDLQTGATMQSSTPVGEGVGHLTWSPDGTRLLAEDMRGPVLLDPEHPSLAGSAHLRAPAGCTYSDPVWTTQGIVVNDQCGAVGRLTRVSAAGTVEQHWPLPACGGSRSIVTDATRTEVFLLVEQGYGNDGPCAVEKISRAFIATIDGPALRTIQTLPMEFSQTTLAAG